MNNIKKESNILIVSHNSLSLHSNNGKTLTSIFSGWSKSGVAQLYFQEEIPESILFDNFYRIRDIDVLKRLFSFGFSNSCGGKIEARERVYFHYESAARLKILVLSILRTLNSVKLIFRDLIYGTGLWRSSDFYSWLKCFKPDSVFFVGGNSVFSFNVAKFIADQAGIPFDIYITDDYVLNFKPKGILGRFMHRRLLGVYKRYFSYARHVFVIGEDMADSFGAYFEREFIPIMNSIDMDDSLSSSSCSLKEPGCVDIVYAGSLHLGRDRALIQFAKLINHVAFGFNLKININIYTPQDVGEKLISELAGVGVSFGGSLDQSQLRTRISSADFVLHVESFDAEFVNLTKLSVSTKIPEYLSSGTCVIAYGPSEIASIRLIAKNGIGVCITERDGIDDVKNKLGMVFNSEIIRGGIVRKGFEYAKSNFDSVVVRRKLKMLLNTKE